MNVHYVSDAQGRQTAVQISIADWNALKAKYAELDEPEKPKRKPSDFRGTISAELGDQLREHVKQARSEWETVKPRKKASDFVGILSKETAQQMIADIEQDRNEWE